MRRSAALADLLGSYAGATGRCDTQVAPWLKAPTPALRPRGL